MDIENAFISADWEKLIRYYNKYTQKPAEWSEEDERIFKGVFGKINHDQSYGVSKADMLAWLKARRPQPHWKPSEDQMGALLAVINLPANAGSGTCQLELRDLYEHLKKL